VGRKQVIGILENIGNLNKFDRYGFLSDLKYSFNMRVFFLRYFENELDIGVWYEVFTYIRAKLYFAREEHQIQSIKEMYLAASKNQTLDFLARITQGALSLLET